MRISSKIPTIPLLFWDELFKAQKSEYPSICKKYNIGPEQLNYVAAHMQEVFDRLLKSEDGKKSWDDGASRYYSKF
jgi:hypothetical protein